MHWVRFFVACLLLAACSGSSTPATTPTFVPTTASTTTTTLAPTTTLDRVTEVEVILQDLEQRRLDAVYQGDREGYRALFASEAFVEASMIVFDELDFDLPPVVEVEVLPSGRNCHPTLEAYPVAATYTWWGEYRVGGGSWIPIGTLDLTTTVLYDVDEVFGVLIDP